MGSDVQESAESSSSIHSTLLRAVRQQDEAAWAKLVKLFTPLIYEWCRGQGLQPADAADTVQEVFRAVAGKIGDFRRDRPSDSFRGWLWTITRNKIRDEARARTKRPQTPGGSDMLRHIEAVPSEPPVEPPDDTSTSSGSDTEHRLYQRALALIREQFTERTWQAFWRTAAQGDQASDVAADLEMTVNAVRLAKARVLRRLRDEFGDLLR